MKKKQLDKKAMYLVVKKNLTSASEEIISEMPGAAELIVELGDTLKLLSNYSGAQSTDITGYSEKKTELKVEMVQRMVAVCNCVKSYAKNNNLTVLFTQMNRSYKYLINSSAVGCVTTCRGLLKTAKPLLGELAAYRVTALVLAELEESIDAYDKYIPEPRVNIVNRNIATEGIAKMVKRCDAILGHLDILVMMLQTRHKGFFEGYFKRRKIIDTGSQTLSIRGFVCGSDGVGLSHVRIYIDGKKRVRRTTAKGNFQMKHLDDGMYTLTFKRPGFTDLVVVVTVVKGVRSEVRVVMNCEF